MGDWADELALKFIRDYNNDPLRKDDVTPLAALLREVALMGPSHDAKTLITMAKARDAQADVIRDVARRDTLAEVRRVVNQVRDDAPVTCAHILACLEKP